MSPENLRRHGNYSRRLMLQARYELDWKGDRMQASDKGSGAVAHAVKACGADRGWRHNSHSLRREIMALLSAEFARPELIALQGVADQLHENFFEDRMHDSHLDLLLIPAADWLESLLEVLELGVNPAFTPTAAQQRIIDRLSLTAEEIRGNALLDYPPPMPPFIPPEEEEDAEGESAESE